MEPATSEDVGDGLVVQNMVLAGQIYPNDRRIDTRAIASAAPLVFQLRTFTKFSILMTKTRDSLVSVVIYSNGKMMATGASTRDQGISAFERTTTVLNNLGFEYSWADLSVHNVVLGCFIHPVDLDALKETVDRMYPPLPKTKPQWHEDRDDVCRYNKTYFPGADIRLELMGLALRTSTMTIFCSGKIYMSGFNSEAAARDAFRCVYETFLARQRPADWVPLQPLGIAIPSPRRHQKNSTYIDDLNLTPDQVKTLNQKMTDAWVQHRRAERLAWKERLGLSRRRRILKK